ncbi:MAG TPA: DNA gyrase inhibitor YacG [Alphaproteobacteria bacterium]|nr:DNA gyrase inhibitor YacG [Alphaproteobacteria bacterium]
MAKTPPTFCPTCRKPAADKYKPFCSARCADIDLGRWLGGKYRVESEEKPDAAPEPDADDRE